MWEENIINNLWDLGINHDDYLEQNCDLNFRFKQEHWYY